MNREERKKAMKMATAIAEMGWRADIVPASEYDGIHANYHTHGLQENFGHIDFQVVLPIDPSKTHAVMFQIIENIKEGKVYEEGKLYDDIIPMPMGFKVFKECGRDVLRLLIPDGQGRHPDDPQCEPFFRLQLDDYPFDS
ncbi:DUF4262 domain-containing protein [Paenibacillus agilis]|nr:DUF4262 domain-containing protein [Paenibacillus agilis]